MSYLDYYGLKEAPFANAPDLRFYFDGYQYGHTEERLLHIIDQMEGLGVIIGDIGAGKTILARHLLERLDSNEYEAGLLVIVHTAITASWLMKKIALQLGITEPADDKVQIITQLFNRLVEINEEGRKAVVLIDEANMLQSKEIMEEFRGLLNLEVPGKKLITFILFGMPELDQNLNLDLPLKQRIALRIPLKPLDEKASFEYIAHRLKIAGSTKELFDKETLKLIYDYSLGMPRLINVLCDNSLLEGYLEKKSIINKDIVMKIAEDLGLMPALQEEEAKKAKKEKDSFTKKAGFV